MLKQMAQGTNAESLHVKADGTGAECRDSSCSRWHGGQMQSFLMLKQITQWPNAEFLNVKADGTRDKCRVSSC